MTARRSTPTRTTRPRIATVLAGAAVLTLAGTSGAGAAPSATSAGDSLPAVTADAGRWPPELVEGSRLFVNPYRSYLVEIHDGEPTLVLATGFAACYFMTQQGVRSYPC
jgi:hypothetical protein